MLSEKHVQIPVRDNTPATNIYCKVFQKENAALGVRPVMLLAPGGPGGNHTVYLPIAEHLLKFADLILFDPRGCGGSDSSDAKYCTIDHYIDDMDAIRVHFNLNKIILLGASYGAMASLGYAIRYPDHLTKLILLAGAPSYKFIETAKKNLQKKGTDEQKEIAQKLWNGAFRDAKEFAEYYKIMMPLYSVNSTVEPPTTSTGIPYNIEVTNLGFSQFLRTFNFENEMENISCPTLIICGADDWINDPCHARFMAEKISKSILHIFDHCGHFAEDDQPKLFFHAVSNFLENKILS
jgi:proline iminopeptidase